MLHDDWIFFRWIKVHRLDHVAVERVAGMLHGEELLLGNINGSVFVGILLVELQVAHALAVAVVDAVLVWRLCVTVAAHVVTEIAVEGCRGCALTVNRGRCQPFHLALGIYTLHDAVERAARRLVIKALGRLVVAIELRDDAVIVIGQLAHQVAVQVILV